MLLNKFISQASLINQTINYMIRNSLDHFSSQITKHFLEGLIGKCIVISSHWTEPSILQFQHACSRPCSPIISSCHTKLHPRRRRGASISEAFYKWQAAQQQLIAHSLSNSKLQHSCKFRTCKFSLSTVSMQIQAYITRTANGVSVSKNVSTFSHHHSENFFCLGNSGKNFFCSLLSGCILRLETPHPFKIVNLSNVVCDGYVILI